jgi:hypothetical protein
MPGLRKLSLSTDKEVYGRGETVRAVAHLHASLPGRNRRVSLYYRPAGSDHRILLIRRTPNRQGNVYADFRITRQARLSVVVTTGRGTWRTYLTRTVSRRHARSQPFVVPDRMKPGTPSSQHR